MKSRRFTILLLSLVCAVVFCLPAAAADAGIRAKKIEQLDGYIRLTFEVMSAAPDAPADNAKISASTKKAIRYMVRNNNFTSVSLAVDDRQAAEQDSGLSFVHSTRTEDMFRVTNPSEKITYDFRNVLKVTHTRYTQTFLENNISVALTADTHWDGTEYQRSYYSFMAVGQSISDALYTATDGRAYRIYSILDADERCIAQYVVFQYGNTDYSLVVCGLPTASGSYTELPTNLTHELLDTMVYPET